MASLMENLIEVLEQESKEYEGLLGLSRRKTPIIVSGDLDELQQVTDEEQELVGRISQLDRKRTEFTADIANVLNKDVANLKITNLIEMMSGRPAEQRRLLDVHDKLGFAVRELRRVNEQNRELLANALEMVGFELSLLQASSTAPTTANYTRNAYSAGDTMGVASGRFDAKQ